MVHLLQDLQEFNGVLQGLFDVAWETNDRENEVCGLVVVQFEVSIGFKQQLELGIGSLNKAFDIFLFEQLNNAFAVWEDLFFEWGGFDFFFI